MARIPDKDRITRLLTSEGGSLGRREIMEALGLSDERYELVAADMVAEKRASKNRGRTGGLTLITPTARPVGGSQPKVFDARATQPRSASAEATQPSAFAMDDGSNDLEKDLYPPFSKYLQHAAVQGGESKTLILETWQTKAGKWETPDFTEVRITPFPMVGQWELRLAVYEIKRADGWNVESVFQAATYLEFAHESWLVVPENEDTDWVELFTKRVVEKASDQGVGLMTFNPVNGIIRKHMAPRRSAPALSRQQEWLERTLDKLKGKQGKDDVASHIRWARDMATSGRP